MWFNLFGATFGSKCPLGCFGGSDDDMHLLSECPRGKFRLGMLNNRSFSNLAGLRLFCLQPSVVKYGIADDQTAAVVATLGRQPLTLTLLLLWVRPASAIVKLAVNVTVPQCPSICAVCIVTLHNDRVADVSFAPGTGDKIAEIVRAAWAFCHVDTVCTSISTDARN